MVPESALDQSLDSLILRISAAASLFPLGLVLLMSLHEIPQMLMNLKRTLPILICIPIIAIYSALNGLVMGNDIGFVTGDTYKLLSLPFGVLVGMTLPLQLLCKAFLRMSVLNAILFVVMVLPARYRGDLLVVGLGTYHLLAAMCALPLVDKNIVRFQIILTVTLAVMVGLKRSTILVFIVLLAFIGIKDRKMRSVLVVFALIVGGQLAYFGEEVKVINDLYERIEETHSDGKLDTSSGSRIQEIRSSWTHMSTTAVLGPVQILLIGMGSGATYPHDSDELRLNPISDSSTEVHNIHFTPMTLIFRHGILSALLLLAAYGSCLLYCYQSWITNHNEKIREISKFIFLFGLSLSITSLSGFTIVGDLMFPVLVGSLIRAIQLNGDAVNIAPRPSQADTE